MQLWNHTLSEAKQTCQCTNYPNTTNYSGYNSQLELLQSYDIHAAYKHISKHLTHPKIILKQCPIMEAVYRYNVTPKDNVLLLDCFCQPDSSLPSPTERYHCTPSRWAQTAEDRIQCVQSCLDKVPLCTWVHYGCDQPTECPCWQDTPPYKGPSSCHGFEYFGEWEWQQTQSVRMIIINDTVIPHRWAIQM